MIYMLDTANTEEISRLAEQYPVSGVTTNPSIIAREAGSLQEQLRAIREIIGEDVLLHAQVLGTDTSTMMQEALQLHHHMGNNFLVKIPVTVAGIQAIKTLSKKNVRVTATAIFTAQQALMAAVQGAEFLAPYMGRIDNYGGDAIRMVADTAHLLKQYNLPAKILAAGFTGVQQIHGAAMAGAHAITATPDFFEQMIDHPLTASRLQVFRTEWEERIGAPAKAINISTPTYGNRYSDSMIRSLSGVASPVT